MKLRDLIARINPAPRVVGSLDTEVTDITADSRQVAPGYLFVAERGVNVDGHTFIPRAVEAGAAAVVCETLPAEPAEGVAWVVVESSAEALGWIAAARFGYPSEKLTLVGVTGTNGKTTTATLLYQMARMLGEKAGLLSTVVNRVDTLAVPATHTTPDAISLQRLLARMVEAGCTFCAMEVSSHAAAQRRIAGLRFRGGVFTNLTRDHLDYHGTFDNYLRAKKSFFDSLPASAFALANADDRNGAVMLQNTPARKATYSLRQQATFTAAVVEDRLDGMLLRIDGHEVETRFTGRFNAYNLLAVYGAARLCGWEQADVLKALSALRPVDGRMQTFTNCGVTAIVDYAHTPDALENVLATIREVITPGARIITVTGAGGDRDRGKRPLMAAAAARLGHTVVLTADNPRSEDPMDIIAQMLEGIPAADRGRAIVEPDRATAIARAVAMAQPGDVVLVAGKGHEDYQIVGTEKRHFDDREHVARALRACPIKYVKAEAVSH